MEKDLPELLSFFQFPRHLWRKLRTTNVIERKVGDAKPAQRFRPSVDILKRTLRLRKFIYESDRDHPHTRLRW